MWLHPKSTKNVFQLYADVRKLPFAMSRHHWSDHDLAVVTKVVPQGKYGLAYGFSVRDGVPNDHFTYSAEWTKEMRIPNAGSYQWRLIDVPEFRLHELVNEFYRDLAPQFGFIFPQEEENYEKEWMNGMLRETEKS